MQPSGTLAVRVDKTTLVKHIVIGPGFPPAKTRRIHPDECVEVVEYLALLLLTGA